MPTIRTNVAAAKDFERNIEDNPNAVALARIENANAKIAELEAKSDLSEDETYNLNYYKQILVESTTSLPNIGLVNHKPQESSPKRPGRIYTPVNVSGGKKSRIRKTRRNRKKTIRKQSKRSKR